MSPTHNELWLQIYREATDRPLACRLAPPELRRLHAAAMCFIDVAEDGTLTKWRPDALPEEEPDVVHGLAAARVSVQPAEFGLVGDGIRPGQPLVPEA